MTLRNSERTHSLDMDPPRIHKVLLPWSRPHLAYHALRTLSNSALVLESPQYHVKFCPRVQESPQHRVKPALAVQALSTVSKSSLEAESPKVQFCPHVARTHASPCQPLTHIFNPHVLF